MLFCFLYFECEYYYTQIALNEMDKGHQTINFNEFTDAVNKHMDIKLDKRKINQELIKQNGYYKKI